MRNFVNKDKIIEAYISEPHQNSGESWDSSSSHGWQLILVLGYIEGYKQTHVIETESEEASLKKAEELGLTMTY